MRSCITILSFLFILEVEAPDCSYHWIEKWTRDLVNMSTVSEAASNRLSVEQSVGVSEKRSEGQFDGHIDWQREHQRTVRRSLRRTAWRTVRPCKQYIMLALASVCQAGCTPSVVCHWLTAYMVTELLSCLRTSGMTEFCKHNNYVTKVTLVLFVILYDV
jgi:hypothetical protein